MSSKKQKTDERKQEEEDDNSLEEFLIAFNAQQSAEPSAEELHETARLNKQYEKKVRRFADSHVSGWVDMVKDPENIDDVRKCIDSILYSTNIKGSIVRYEPSMSYKLPSLDFAMLKFLKSGLTDYSGYDGLCVTDKATKAKVQTMANTLKLHGGITKKQAAMIHEKEKITIESDDSDDSDDFEPRRKKDVKAGAKDEPRSEEEKDWGEMEEVSDEDYDPKDPEYKP